MVVPTARFFETACFDPPAAGGEEGLSGVAGAGAGVADAGETADGDETGAAVFDPSLPDWQPASRTIDAMAAGKNRKCRKTSPVEFSLAISPKTA